MNLKFKTLIALLTLVVTISSCINDDDFDTPNVTCNDAAFTQVPATAKTSMQNVIAMYNTAQSLTEIAALDDDPIYLEGYVTSNDLKGNFYRELFIQDKFENPNYALKLGINVRSLYTKYVVGSKILVKLNGLAITKSHGELVIGESRNGGLSDMREKIALKNIIRSCTQETIIPIEINSSTTINDDLLGKFIKLTDAQIISSAVGLPFVDPNNNFDSQREIVFCSDISTLKLETSSFAAYAQSTLPEEKFNVSGILSRDYGDDNYVLKINSPADFEFLTAPRCDPLFEESFTDGFGNWTNYNVNGAQIWEIDDTQSPSGNYAKMSGYAGSSQDNEDWLISPAVDLGGTTNPVLSFNSARNYNGPDLEVYISKDYTAGENPNNSGTWLLLNATLSSGSWNWVNSGSISLIDYADETVFVAFKYISTTSGSATYEIDNVIIDEM